MAAEPPPPGRASGKSSGNRRGGGGQGRGHQAGRGLGGAGDLGRPEERGGSRRRPRALARGAREKRPPRPASHRRPRLLLPRERSARLAPCSAAVAAPPLSYTPPRREHIHRGFHAASGRRRLPAPGRRLTRLPGALGPARAHRSAGLGSRANPARRPPRALRLRLRLCQTPTPGPDCQARSGCSVRALPLATHTHFLLSLNWSTDPGGREKSGEGGGQRREEEEEERAQEEGSGGGAARPLLEGFPGLQPPRRASLPVRLSLRPRGSRLGLRTPPSPAPSARPADAAVTAGGGAARGRWTAAAAGPGCRRPAAAGWPPGRGEAGTWRPAPCLSAPGPRARPRATRVFPGPVFKTPFG